MGFFLFVLLLLCLGEGQLEEFPPDFVNPDNHLPSIVREKVYQAFASHPRAPHWVIQLPNADECQAMQDKVAPEMKRMGFLLKTGFSDWYYAAAAAPVSATAKPECIFAWSRRPAATVAVEGKNEKNEL